MRHLALLAGLAALATVSPSAAAADPVTFSVAFGDGAHLGRATSITVALRVDRWLAPMTEFRLLTPAGIDFTSSRLGAASCRRPAGSIASILGPVVQHPCPENSLMGSGSATANLLLDPAAPIVGATRIELHAGGPVEDKPGLVVMANTYNPARMQLTYVGYLYVPPTPFGLGLAIRVPPIPRPPFGAPVALSTMRLTVGPRSIVYHRRTHGRRVAYRPGGIQLPRRCRHGRFRFRAILRFADGSRRAAGTAVRCPRA